MQAVADTKDEHADDDAQAQNHYGGDSGAAQYEEDAEEEDDDDIDFNLGNGPSATAVTSTYHDEKPAYSTPPAPAAPAKGPNAKEDG